VAILRVVGAEVKDCGGSYNCNFGWKQEQSQELGVHPLPDLFSWKCLIGLQNFVQVLTV
jgi:hypothetical protein